MKLSAIMAILLAIVLTGCENYFGKKTDVGFIDPPDFQSRDAAYVPILPVLDDFSYPTDVSAGFDQLLYVVDNGTHEVIALDQAGTELGRVYVPGAIKATQTRNLDLLVVGSFDTIINGLEVSLSAIYRVDQRQGTYSLNSASVQKKIIHPFYYKSGFSLEDAEIEFTGIAPLADNSYYVSRKGDGANLFGANNAVLLFNKNDEFQSPINVSTSSGELRTDYFVSPISITSLCQPPQWTVSNSKKFIALSDFDNLNVKPDVPVVVIEKYESDNGASFNPEETTINDFSKAKDFLQRPKRFKQGTHRPEQITISGDGTNYIFIVDSEADSLYQFSYDLEGVKPPPGSEEDQYILVSFGGTGSGVMQFNDPKGVAYLDEVVYVADAGNHRLLRFKLTLDFD